MSDLNNNESTKQYKQLRDKISTDIALKFPRLKYENKSLFDGIENFFKEKYLETNRAKPINFTSRKYKKYVKQMDFSNREGYQRLKEAIQHSYQTVKKVKRGISLQEQESSTAFTQSLSQNSLPIFENKKIKQDLHEYLDLQVGNYSNLAPGLKLKGLMQQQQQQQNNMSSINNIHNKSSILLTNVESSKSLLLQGNNNEGGGGSQTRLLLQDKLNQKNSSVLLNHTVSQNNSNPYDMPYYNQQQPSIIRSRNCSNIMPSKSQLGRDYSTSSISNMNSNSKRNLSTIQNNSNNINQHPYGETQDLSIKQDPKKKFEELQQKFEFPINPAFFHSSVVKQPKRLVSLDTYCKENNIQLTKHQSVQNTLQKIQKEHKFWNDKFSNIIKGYRDTELNEQIVQFVNDIDYSNMSQAEMELIFSKEMNMNKVGRTLRNNVQKFFDTNRDKKMLKTIEEKKKVRAEQLKQSEYKHSYTLLNETLTKNNNFDLKKLEKINEEAALARRSKTNLKINNNHQNGKDSNAQTTTTTKGKLSFKMKRPIVQQHLYKKPVDSDNSSDDRGASDNESAGDGDDYQFHQNRWANNKAGVGTTGSSNKIDSQNGSFKAPLHARNNIHRWKNQQQQLEQNRRQLILEEHKNSMIQMHNQLTSMTQQIEKIELDDRRRQMSKEYKTIREKKESHEKEDLLSLKKYLHKHFHRRNIQIAKLVNTTDRIQVNNQVMSAKLQKMLDRVEIDRPLLFKEKLQALWREQENKQRQMSPDVMQRLYGEELFDASKLSVMQQQQKILMDQQREQQQHNNSSMLTLDQSTLSAGGGMTTNRNLRQQLESKKLDRMRLNAHQKDLYKKILHAISTRRKDNIDMDIQAEEIRILELMKIILDGGWIIDAQVYEVMIEISGIEDVFNSYMEAVGDAHHQDIANKGGGAGGVNGHHNQDESGQDDFIQVQLQNMSDDIDQKLVTVLKTAELISENFGLVDYQFLIPRHRKK